MAFLRPFVPFLFTLPNELLWEIIFLLGTQDLKQLRLVSPAFRILGTILFRNMIIRVTPNFVEDVEWFVSRGNMDLTITTMIFQSPITYRGRRGNNTWDTLFDGLEIMADSNNLAHLHTLRLFEASTELIPLMYAFHKLGVNTVRSVIVRRFTDEYQYGYIRKAKELNSFLNKIEYLDITILDSQNDKFFQWILDNANTSNLKTLMLSKCNMSLYPPSRTVLLPDRHLGMNGRISKSLNNITISSYVVNIRFFGLQLFRRANHICEIKLVDFQLLPQDWATVSTEDNQANIWENDGWRKVIENINREYQDTDCIVKIKRPWQPGKLQNRHWVWCLATDLKSTSPSVEVEF